jgi:hypothetical protein
MRNNSHLIARSSAANFTRKLGVFGLLALAGLSANAFAQMGGGASNPELQQKIAALKQSAAENKQRLHQYQWVETQQITFKGDEKPQKVFQCSYGPNGQVVKVPMGEQQQAPQQKGRLRERVVEKKTDEMKEYMQQVQSLLSMYVPPNPELIQQAMQKQNVSIDKTMGSSLTNIVFKNYAKEGDQMTLGFDAAAKKIATINVNTYMDKPGDAVTLAVRMNSLPDGTNYAQQTMLNATAKQIQVTTTNSNYAKLQ